MFKKCFMCRIEALGVTCTGRYAECFYSVLLQTHRKPSQGNPPEIFSGKPTGNFLRKPTGNLPRETHRKSSQGNPPEIFSGNPPEIFSGNPPEIFSGNPPEIFSGKPHRKSCQRPTLNQIKSGGITVNPGNLVRPNQIWWNHGEPTGNLVRQTRPEPKQILWWNHREVTGNTAC